MVLDPGASEPRPGTHADWLATTRLIDAVDDIGVYWAMVDGCLEGESARDWVSYNIELARSFSKHVNDSFSRPEWAPWLLEILGVLFGGRDEVRRRHPYSFLLTPVSPLIVERGCADAWLALRGWDIPVLALPMPMMGTTAPGSMLATALLANCETLGTLCFIQAAEPGTPFVYAPIALTMDARSGRYAGTTAHSAIGVAGVEMARYYGLPVMGSASGTDAYLPGEQAGYEKAFSTLFGQLAWPDLMVGPGCLGGATVLSHAQLLMDVEVFRMARAAHDGVDVAAGRWLTDELARQWSRRPLRRGEVDQGRRARRRVLPAASRRPRAATSSGPRPDGRASRRRRRAGRSSCSPPTSRSRWRTTWSGSSGASSGVRGTRWRCRRERVPRAQLLAGRRARRPAAAGVARGARRRGRRHRRRRLHGAVDRLLPRQGRPAPACGRGGEGHRRLRRLGAQRRLGLSLLRHPADDAGQEPRPRRRRAHAARDVRHRRGDRPRLRRGGHRRAVPPGRLAVGEHLAGPDAAGARGVRDPEVVPRPGRGLGVAQPRRGARAGAGRGLPRGDVQPALRERPAGAARARAGGGGGAARRAHLRAHAGPLRRSGRGRDAGGQAQRRRRASSPPRATRARCPATSGTWCRSTTS